MLTYHGFHTFLFYQDHTENHQLAIVAQPGGIASIEPLNF
jgi:hypothetical protein